MKISKGMVVMVDATQEDTNHTSMKIITEVTV
jgi:signal recognition particle receptor subunit beta